MSSSLLESIPLAIPSPSQVSSPDGGAYIALALHVMMVNHGFQCTGACGAPAPRRRGRNYTPPDCWDRRFNDEEWVFEYRRRDLVNPIVLHLSLQKESKRLFVQGKEVLMKAVATGREPERSGARSYGGVKERPDRAYNLGLQLPNYVPDPAAARAQSTWAKVYTNLDRMADLFGDHVLTPLMAGAEKAEPRPAGVLSTVHEWLFGAGAGAGGSLSLADPWVYMPVAGLVVGGAAVVAYRVYSAKQR